MNAKEPNPDIHRKFISKNHKKKSDHVFYDWPSLFVHHWTKPIIQIEIGANKALSAIRIWNKSITACFLSLICFHFFQYNYWFDIIVWHFLTPTSSWEKLGNLSENFCICFVDISQNLKLTFSFLFTRWDKGGKAEFTKVENFWSKVHRFLIFSLFSPWISPLMPLN